MDALRERFPPRETHDRDSAFLFCAVAFGVSSNMHDSIALAPFGARFLLVGGLLYGTEPLPDRTHRICRTSIEVEVLPPSHPVPVWISGQCWRICRLNQSVRQTLATIAGWVSVLFRLVMCMRAVFTRGLFCACVGHSAFSHPSPLLDAIV